MSNQFSVVRKGSFQLSAVGNQLAIPYSTNRPISYSTASPNEPNELNEPYEPLLPFNQSTIQLLYRSWRLE
jgi:hypothetical protein